MTVFAQHDSGHDAGGSHDREPATARRSTPTSGPDGRGGQRAEMTRSPALHFVRSDDDRVVAGVCGGIAERSAGRPDPRAARLRAARARRRRRDRALRRALALHATGGGRRRRRRPRRRGGARARRLGLSAAHDRRRRAPRRRRRRPLAARRHRCARARRSRSPGSCSSRPAPCSLLRHRGASTRSRPRRGRRRAAARRSARGSGGSPRAHRAHPASHERAEVAARVHDSVLQTLALIQRHADEPRRVASLARRQERELRGWLYGSGADDAATRSPARSPTPPPRSRSCTASAVELASGGDCPLDDGVDASCSPRARRCRTRPSSPAPTRSPSTPRPTTTHASVFVRDRGAGFDRAAVPADRRGLAESIEGRMARAGGTATIVSSPGDGHRGRADAAAERRVKPASCSSTTTRSSAPACAASSATRSRSSARPGASPRRCR